MTAVRPYRSARARAWRNLMVAGINAGLERRLFTLEPAPVTDRRRAFPFNLDGRPAVCRIEDVGRDELSVLVSVAGGAEARGWLGQGRDAPNTRDARTRTSRFWYLDKYDDGGGRPGAR